VAHSPLLAERVRDALRRERGIREKRMFGGLAFLLDGNLLVGVWTSSLVVRLGFEQASEALREPHVAPFAPSGRPMRGWVIVEADGLEHDRQLVAWIDRAAAFVRTLPAK
jgi:hypothetical protein